MRQRPDALILIAIYEFVMAAMLLIVACVVLPIALLITPFASNGFGQFLGRFVVVGLLLTIVFGFGIASGIVGFGLLMLKEWARIGAILLAIPALIIFPIWTVLAILIIVYLAGEEGRALFRHSRRAAMVSVRTLRQEASTGPPAGVESSVNPPFWRSSPDLAEYGEPNDAGTRNAPDEPGATLAWQEARDGLDDRESPDDDIIKPPAG